jgi:ribonuclease BN (tRNA processing enzyme)
MRLTVLGSGTGFPSSIRGGPGYLVESGGCSVIMDLGMGTLSKLHGLGTILENLGPVLVSHLHPDHVAELVSLLFALNNPSVLRKQPLVLVGCLGLKRLLDDLQKVHGDWIIPKSYSLEVRELEHGELQYGDLIISAIPVEHTAQSVGFRLTGGQGKVLSYSGDTDFCSGLIELVRDADLAVMECSFPDELKCPGHLTPSEAGQAASRGGAKQVVLSHLYPQCEGVDLVSQCRTSYNGIVTVAEDLMSLDL